MNSRTEASHEDRDPKIRDFSPEKHQQQPEEEATDAVKKHTRAVSSVHPAPRKEYGIQWEWSSEKKDYIHKIGDITVCYRDYQRTGGVIPSKAQAVPSATGKDEGQGESSSKKDPSSSTEKDEKDTTEEGYVNISHSEAASASRQNSVAVPKSLPPPKQLKEYEEPLDEGFTIVDKPKRFFQVGRIFATVWFEPGGENPPGRKPDLEWTKDCPKYHDEKPIAKFRWFVVVRKRLHHSLCFNITTIGPKGPRKADRGRGQDFVVLHNSNVEPSKPHEVEGITREPIAVIIEAGEESISPWARLDCGRIYTVEDHLRVMKIGRVHTASLDNLERYFRESVT
ncbi:hypothetical protein V8F20_004901 [Naviculisporaceae sp. PSN 640]